MNHFMKEDTMIEVSSDEYLKLLAVAKQAKELIECLDLGCTNVWYVVKADVSKKLETSLEELNNLNID